MRNPILNYQELKDFGFKENKRGNLDHNGFYDWYSLKKNNYEIVITYEYEANRTFITGNVEFNCEVLKGRTLTKSDLKILIEIM